MPQSALLALVLSLYMTIAAFAAEAQQPGRVWRIGVLIPASADANPQYRDAFVQGLREHGLIDGKNIALEWRLPIVRTTEILRDVLLRPAGIEIYVENPKSALYPSIPEAPTDLFSGTVSASLRP